MVVDGEHDSERLFLRATFEHDHVGVGSGGVFRCTIVYSVPEGVDGPRRSVRYHNGEDHIEDSGFERFGA